MVDQQHHQEKRGGLERSYQKSHTVDKMSTIRLVTSSSSFSAYDFYVGRTYQVLTDCGLSLWNVEIYLPPNDRFFDTRPVGDDKDDHFRDKLEHYLKKVNIS